MSFNSAIENEVLFSVVVVVDMIHGEKSTPKHTQDMLDELQFL